MNSEALQGIVDHLYEAATVTERWPAVMETLASMVNGAGAALFESEHQRWVATPVASQLLAEFAALGPVDWNLRSLRAIARRQPSFFVDHDIFTEQELATEPLYNQFLRPRGFGWCAGTSIPAPNGDTLIFLVERALSSGPMSRADVAVLDCLRPHIKRAAILSAQFGSERAYATPKGLDLVGVPAGVLSTRHRLMTANAHLDALIPAVVRDGQARLSLADPAADQQLAAYLTTQPHPNGAAPPIALRAVGGQPAMILHLFPLRGAAQDVFVSAGHILLLAPVSPLQSHSESALTNLFDLTPAEARVAHAIADGDSIDSFAQRAGMSRETVRTHLKSVFAKTGTRRQVDLVRVLASPLRLEAART